MAQDIEDTSLPGALKKKAKSKAKDPMMPRKMLLRGQRCKTAKQMKTYVHDYVGLHLLGSPGYKSIEELVEKLESPLITDPKSPRRKAATRLLSSPPLTPAGTLSPPSALSSPMTQAPS